MINTLLFDFDDTLVDRLPGAYDTYSAYIELIAKERADYEKEAIKQDCLLYEAKGNLPKPFVLEKISKKYNLPFEPEKFLDFWNHNVSKHVYPFKEVREILLDFRKQHYKLGCVTNGNNLAQYGKIKQAGILDCFDYIITSEDAKEAKPKATMFNLALKALKAKKENCLFVGDTFSADIYGALACGIKAIWIGDKKRPCNYPIKRIEHIRELKQILEEENG